MEYFKIFIIFLHIFFDLEEIIFENFNISENNIINVELAKVLKYISNYFQITLQIFGPYA